MRARREETRVWGEGGREERRRETDTTERHTEADRQKV